MKFGITNKITGVVNSVAYGLRKASPEISLGIGIGHVTKHARLLLRSKQLLKSIRRCAI